MPRRSASSWSPGAFGVGLVVLGLVYSSPLFILGVVMAGITALQWTVYAWSDHATADPFANRKVRHELTYPLDFPLFAIISIFLFVFALSRVLLALPKTADTIVFGAVPAVAFVVAIILNFREKVSRNVIAALAVVGAAIVLGLGIWGMVKGYSSIEKDENTPHPYQIKGVSEGAAGAPITVQITGKEIR